MNEEYNEQENKKEKGGIAGFFHDLALSVLAGGTAALAAFLLPFAIGLPVSGWNVRSALNASRSALFITGALLMLLSAGMLIRKPSEKRMKGYRRWKEHFRVFGLFPAFLTASVTILTVAGILDYVLYYS